MTCFLQVNLVQYTELTSNKKYAHGNMDLIPIIMLSHILFMVYTFHMFLQSAVYNNNIKLHAISEIIYIL